MRDQDTADERWRPVVEWEGFYEVSNVGRVRSVARMVRNRFSTRLIEGRIKAPGHHPYGYESHALTAEGRTRKTLLAHRMVLEAFVQPRPDDQVARHLNGDCTDNRVENLSWGTQKENIQDAVRHGRMKRGSESHLAKLTEAKVTQMRREYPAVRSYRRLAEKYGICVQSCHNAVTGKTWAHVPGAIHIKRKLRKS